MQVSLRLGGASGSRDDRWKAQFSQVRSSEQVLRNLRFVGALAYYLGLEAGRDATGHLPARVVIGEAIKHGGRLSRVAPSLYRANKA